jgi:hypothetical protein
MTINTLINIYGWLFTLHLAWRLFRDGPEYWGHTKILCMTKTGRPWQLRLESKLADLWVGAFWSSTPASPDTARLDFYLCLVPCLPLHLVLWYKVSKN